MKLSFCLSSSKPPKPSLKQSPSQDEPPNKQFVTEFDPSKPLTNLNSKTLDVIAPIPNQWNPKKNLHLPHKSEDPNLQFQVLNSTTDDSSTSFSYGLNIRTKKDPEPDSKPNNNTSVKTTSSSSSWIDKLMLDKLRNDLKSLPEDKGMNDFDDMPVENFAKALLKGYGWSEGQGVGKNAKEDVKVFQFKKRTGKEGLGFVNNLPPAQSNNNNNDNNNREKNSKNETVRGSKSRSRTSSSSRDHKRESENNDKKTTSNKRRRDGQCEVLSSTWLSRNIRVRVISKELKGGRLYLKKGGVVDVVGGNKCDVCMDGSREVIQGVDEEFLETALPRRGGPVLVLCGRYKGVYGSLQEKDNERETAVVRDADTHELVNVRLEQIAEYVGDLEDIGY